MTRTNAKAKAKAKAKTEISVSAENMIVAVQDPRQMLRAGVRLMRRVHGFGVTSNVIVVYAVVQVDPLLRQAILGCRN